jgi:TonB family protein
MTTAQEQIAEHFAWMSNPAEMQSKRAVMFSIGIAILLHLLIFLFFGLIILGSMFAPKPYVASKPKKIELQMLQPEEDKPMPFTLAPPPPDHPFLDSRGLQISQVKPEHPLFESDADMKAASLLQATGDSLLPGQMGRVLPFDAFQTTRSLLGPAPEPFAPTPPTAQPLPPPPPPTVQVMQQVPDTTPPGAAPQDATPAPPDATATAEKSERTDKQAEETAKKSRYKAVEKLLDSQIALTKREAKPKSVTQIEPPASTPAAVSHAAVLRPMDQQMAKLTTPAPPAPKPQPRRESGYQPEQLQNQIESSITNRGNSGVDSIGTPMGRYRKQVRDAIGSRWHYYVDEKLSLFRFGTVRISFSIDTQGHLSKVQVLSNTSNQSLENVSVRAIRDSEFGAPPPSPELPTGEDPFEQTISFTYFPIQ